MPVGREFQAAIYGLSSLASGILQEIGERKLSLQNYVDDKVSVRAYFGIVKMIQVFAQSM